VFTITTFYTDIYKQPHIDTNMHRLSSIKDKSVYQVGVKNDGRVTANNLRLTLGTNVDIINYSKIMYPEDTVCRVFATYDQGSRDTTYIFSQKSNSTNYNTVTNLLVAVIGYDKASSIAHDALKNNSRNFRYPVHIH
jgi:hypothetical protein